MKQASEMIAIIGKNIKEARIASNLSQEQLAAKLQTHNCDISRGTLAKIEVGLRLIKAVEIKYIKDVLNVDYECLFKII